MRKKQEIILNDITIESVAAEGKALAHVDGTVVFVQFAVPGDVVDIKITKKKKNYMEGYIPVSYTHLTLPTTYTV